MGLPTIAVWIGYDNGDGKRRTLGGGSTGGAVVVPIFDSIIQAVWANVASKTELAAPRLRLTATRVQSIDLESGELRPDRGRGFSEYFRVNGKGKVVDTQYILLSGKSASIANPFKFWPKSSSVSRRTSLVPQGAWRARQKMGAPRTYAAERGLPCMPIETNFSRKLVVVMGVGLVLLLAWQLVDILLLVFASVLVAILFRALADVIGAPTGLPPRGSLVIAVLLVAAFVVTITILFGATIYENVDALTNQLPAAWRAVRARIGDATWLSRTLERGGEAFLSGNVMSRVGGAVNAVLGAVANLFLVIFAGLYIAAQPRLYRRGVLKLVPPQDRDRIDRTMTLCGVALRNWLLGQLIAMVLVGFLTWAGLAALGVPSALALGLFAGLAEFVPIVGPIAAAVVALIFALSQDAQLALWVLALFVAIQQLESNLLQPIIQRKMVSVPPAITLFAVLAFAFLFGVMGALLAAPLAVLTLNLVQDLYVDEIDPDTKDAHGS